jgi:hypothetical protein
MLRRAARALAVFIAMASASIATLALPSVLCAGAIRGPRARWWATVGVAIAALVPLYVHVITIRCGAREFALSSLHPSYEQEGLGRRFMPLHDVQTAGVSTRFHLTAYAALAVRAVTCFAEHPLTGVGPKMFEDRCPVVTMNTYGEWADRRGPHNQIAALVSELGLVGVCLVVAAAWLRACRMTWRPFDPWSAAALVGIVVCSFAGEALVSLRTVGFFAVHLRRRRECSVGVARLACRQGGQ